jgi:CheY-like chemotaxis protein
MALKIFVADDSATIQKIVKLAFSYEDAIIESVADGENALGLIRDFKPDVALIDVFMPGCSGYDICARVKDDPELKHTPVILLVGTFEPFDEAEASRSRCDGHITKPFDTSELIETVHALAGKSIALHDSQPIAETPVMDAQRCGTTRSAANHLLVRDSLSAQVRSSFVGAARVLDLFDEAVLHAANTSAPAADAALGAPGMQTSCEAAALPDELFSESVMNAIVERVVQRVSSEAIREIAWEVVPELSEMIIRRTIEEQKES